MRRFLLRLLWLVPIPAAMVAANLLVDPANLFRGEDYERGIARIMLSGRNVANLTNYDERQVQIAYVQDLTERRQVIVLGSSRSMQIAPDMFPGRTFYNACVSGATIEDHVGLFQLLLEREKAPDVLVFGLDPWILNRHNGQTRWQPLGGACKRALQRLGLPVTPEVESAAAGYWAWEKYEQLLSPSYFQSSLKDAFRRIRDRADPTPRDYYATDRVELPVAVKLACGTISYPSAYVRRSQATVQADAVTYASAKPIYSLGGFDELDPNLRAIFERFVEDCQVRKVRVIFFLAPYHPVVYEALATRPEYAQVAKAEAYFKEQAARRGIPVCGSFSPGACGLSGDDFYDAMHPRREAVAGLLATMGE